jgi:hypothetical protein
VARNRDGIYKGCRLEQQGRVYLDWHCRIICSRANIRLLNDVLEVHR